MDLHEVAKQMKVEQGLLQFLIEGLRATVGWQVSGPDASRKLSSMRFIAESFQRHLERLLALEELDGYMEVVRASCPRLDRVTDDLRAEHDRFRAEARWIVQRLERLPGTNPTALDPVCADLLDLLERIEGHNQKEMALVQEAFEQDEGGGEG